MEFKSDVVSHHWCLFPTSVISLQGSKNSVLSYLNSIWVSWQQVQKLDSHYVHINPKSVPSLTLKLICGTVQNLSFELKWINLSWWTSNSKFRNFLQVGAVVEIWIYFLFKFTRFWKMNEYCEINSNIIICLQIIVHQWWKIFITQEENVNLKFKLLEKLYRL